MNGERLDLSSDPGPDSGDGAGQGSRSYIGVHFVCCDIYTRVYVNRQQTAYVGHCPRCSRRLQIKIGPGGTTNRFFTAS